MKRPDVSAIEQGKLSPKAALSMALFSALAYEDGKKAELQCLDWGFDQATSFDFKGTQGFVCGTDRSIVFSFRGTERKLSDWIRNLKVAKRKVSFGGSVHKGFMEGIDVIWPEIACELIGSQLCEKRIWLTGHSLGGALATIAAASFSPSIAEQTLVVTFGQPRIGNAEFVDKLDGILKREFWRFVNNADIITRIPPGFRHSGTLLRIDGSGQVQISTLESKSQEVEEALDEEEFEKLQNDPESFGVNSLDTMEGPISDHSIRKYIDALRAMVAEE